MQPINLGANDFVTLEATGSKTACLYKRVEAGTPTVQIGSVSFVTIGNAVRAQEVLTELKDANENRQLGELPIFYIADAADIGRSIPNIYLLMIQEAINDDSIEEHITKTECPVCEQGHTKTTKKLLVLSQYLHADCIDEIIDAIDSVWEHADDVLADEL